MHSFHYSKDKVCVSPLGSGVGSFAPIFLLRQSPPQKRFPLPPLTRIAVHWECVYFTYGRCYHRPFLYLTFYYFHTNVDVVSHSLNYALSP